MGNNASSQNSIHEEIMSRLNLGNPFCHSVQNLLFSHLLSKNIKFKVTVILPLFFEGEGDS
jgi:hypothetical protein